VAGAVIRILLELELAEFYGGGGTPLRSGSAERTDLARSAAYRAHTAWLEEARVALGGAPARAAA
jgi:hypothetical protein